MNEYMYVHVCMYVCMYVCVGFQFKGLTGLLLQSNAETQYSVIGVGLSAPEHSGVPNVSENTTACMYVCVCV